MLGTFNRGSDQFGTQGISASRENPFAQRMVRVGLAQESAADILGQIDRFCSSAVRKWRAIWDILIAE